jgi:phospholipid-binding lipoprotein MlaA
MLLLDCFYKKNLLFIKIITFTLILVGCSSLSTENKDNYIDEQINDPLESINKITFSINESMDTYVFHPLATGYRQIVPSFGRNLVRNFIDNLKTPSYFANDMLQGNFHDAAITLKRFLLNTTVGILGLIDIAELIEIPAHKNDFGKTLGIWGIDEGPYLILPILGSSNLRDTFGLIVESFIDPINYYIKNKKHYWIYPTRVGITGISLYENQIDNIDDIKSMSLDYYSSMRSIYQQHRTSLINSAKNDKKSNNPSLNKTDSSLFNMLFNTGIYR